MKINYLKNRVSGIAVLLLSPFVLLFSCQSGNSPEKPQEANPLIGTWKLIEGRLTENGQTTVTGYTGDTSFIKVINPTHFAFLQHDSKKDSTGFFSAGGGHYTLQDSIYTEHLEYCNARSWEEHAFPFTVKIKGDTLIQSGVEKIDSLGINRVNTEVYIKVQ